MPEELDYYLEAEPLTLFREHLAGYPTLLVPAPHRDLSATRELTMDRVIGTRIDIAANLPRLEMPFGKLGADLLRAYLEQIFVHGLIHADPHPGNVLLTDDGWLALVDLGMVVRLPPRNRGTLLKLLLAAVDARGDEVADLAIASGECLEIFDESAWRRRCARLIGRYVMQGAARNLSEGRQMLS